MISGTLIVSLHASTVYHTLNRGLMYLKYFQCFTNQLGDFGLCHLMTDLTVWIPPRCGFRHLVCGHQMN